MTALVWFTRDLRVHDHPPLRAAYLVDRDGGKAFTAAVADQQRHNPELRLLCTGPWPPYSFAAA